MEQRYGVGVANGEVAIDGDAFAAGDGVADCSKSARNAFKSGLLIANVPSSSSFFAPLLSRQVKYLLPSTYAESCHPAML